jgi:hypothetical protein
VSLFVDDPEDCLNRKPYCLLGLPSGQGLGNGVDEGDQAGGVSGNHGIADAGKRDPQPLTLPTDFLLCLPALGDIPDNTVDPHRPAVISAD